MIFKEVRGKYKERYEISYQDLADAGEKNRIHLIVMSPFLFLFGLIDVIVILIRHYNNLQDYLVSIIYFGAFTVSSAFVYVYSILSKRVSQKNSYVYKTIPVYVIVFTALTAAVYNFYILKQPFNGVLTYYLTGFLGLISFSFSPFLFLIGLSVAMGVMVPGIYQNFGVTGLMDSILGAILMFLFSVYKRRLEKRQVVMLKKQTKDLVAKTFGNFTLIYEGKVVKYTRTKSEELIGYLIYKNGSSVKTKELISVLWGDHADSTRYGNNLRNLIVDIKHTMSELEIHDFFIAEYNNFRINLELVKCDYYDFLKGNPTAIKNFAGEFMSQYSWAEDVAAFLEQKALGRKE